MIITDQPNLFVDSGVHSSLYAKSHHQIIFGVVNLSVPRPPPYKWTVWEYDNANIDMTNHDLFIINWYEMFDGLDVNQAVDLFATLFLSVIACHVPNREITCSDRDAPWVTDDVKKAIKRKHCVYHRYVKRGQKPEDWTRVKQVKNDATKMITDAKTNIIPGLAKALWLKCGHKDILEDAAQNNKKQVMNSPPILLNGVFITNFQNKGNLFNEFFVQQCSILQNGSVLPHIDYKTNVWKFNASINEAKIISAIRKLSPNKAHGCDNISIRMLKICDTVITRPLELIYEKCKETERYSLLWKKANIVPAHKKKNCQIMKDYRPILLLPICGKFFEKIVFVEIYEHLTANKLLSDKQSGFLLVTLLLISYCQS